MQGVILAAGKGKRLHPITTQRTKAMAPVAGKPIVERVADLLVDNGIRELIVLVSPDDQEIVPYLQRARPELTWRFVVQGERLGMAHALGLAAPLLRGDFVLSACDNLTPAAHIATLLATHQQQQAHPVRLAARILAPAVAHPVERDEGHQVRDADGRGGPRAHCGGGTGGCFRRPARHWRRDRHPGARPPGADGTGASDSRGRGGGVCRIGSGDGDAGRAGGTPHQ